MAVTRNPGTQALRGAAAGSTTATTNVSSAKQPVTSPQLGEITPFMDYLPYVATSPQTTTALGNDTKYLKIKMPKNQRLLGILLEFSVTTAGSTGSGTAKTSKQIKELKIHDGDENGEVIGYGVGDALDLATLEATVKFRGYTAGGHGQAGAAAGNIPLDTVVAANATYYAAWLIGITAKCLTGTITIEITTNGTATLVGYTTAPTGLTQVEFAIAFAADDSFLGQPDSVYEAIVSYNALKVGLDGVTDVAFAMSNNEFTVNIAGGLISGADTYNLPQIGIIEDISGFMLTGSWTTNLQVLGTTVGTQYFAPTADPQLAVNTPLFVLLLSPHGHVEFSLNTARNVIIVARHNVVRTLHTNPDGSTFTTSTSVY